MDAAMSADRDGPTSCVSSRCPRSVCDVGRRTDGLRLTGILGEAYRGLDKQASRLLGSRPPGWGQVHVNGGGVVSHGVTDRTRSNVRCEVLILV